MDRRGGPAFKVLSAIWWHSNAPNGGMGLPGMDGPRLYSLKGCWIIVGATERVSGSYNPLIHFDTYTCHRKARLVQVHLPPRGLAFSDIDTEGCGDQDKLE